MRSLLILVLVSLSFPNLSCSWFCKNQTPVVVVEKMPTYKTLDRPELHTYKFKKLEDGRVATTREELGDITTDLSALVDLINRYEKLIDDHNRMVENDPGKVELEEPE